jgi:hypothetical protein
LLLYHAARADGLLVEEEITAKLSEMAHGGPLKPS